MGAGASYVRGGSTRRQTAQAAVAVGDLWQLADGRAAVYAGTTAGAASGDPTEWTAANQYTLPKAAVALLDGGRAYWDRSALQVTFRKNADRDFYLGRVVGDAAAGDPNCVVNLTGDQAYDFDLARQPFRSALIGTQAAGGFGGPGRFGSAVKLLLSPTNEAQKADALAKDGFAVGAKAVVELAVEVVSVGAGGAPDLNVGIASGTHATDADAIAQHLFLHVDGNALTAKVQAKDGTHTLAAVTTGTPLVAGVRSEFWFDLRVPSAVKVYQDGVQVLAGTTIDVSAAAGVLYLLAHLEKTAGTDAFEADVDWLRARIMEQGG